MKGQCNRSISNLTRRAFLKLVALGMGTASLSPFSGDRLFRLQDFPKHEKLGRVCYGKWDLKARPDRESDTVGVLYDDDVVPWLKEVVGHWPGGRRNQRWVETPEGYIWGAYLQPVKNIENKPVKTLPNTGSTQGMWAEVTVPWVDAVLINPPPRHLFFRDRYEKQLPLRFYYSQVLWVDQIREADDGTVLYRINEKYGNAGDLYWADGRAFRIISQEEIRPINPDVSDKRILVDISYKRQVLSCFEGNSEVFFCRVSSGVADGSTPIGPFTIYRKLISLHMGGGTAQAGWDTGGVGWTSLFTGGGVAIHSTYWHNNFGEPESNGCVNVKPDDAKWIFRWTQPTVPFDPGDKTITDFSGTPVIISKDE